MGIPDLLTCLLRNLYMGQEATVRTRHRTVDWFKNGKGVLQGCILLSSLHVEHSTKNASFDDSQAGIQITGRNIKQPQVCRWYNSNGRKKISTKEPLDEGERGEWNNWLKIQHSKTRIMASGPTVCVCMCVCACVCLVTQSCPTLCDPMDCSLPGSSAHVDSPGKNNGVGCMPFSREASHSKDWTPSCLHCRQILNHLSHQGSTRILE